MHLVSYKMMAKFASIASKCVMFVCTSPCLVFDSGQGSLLLPFIYYRFLTLRYTSRRNPYCR